MSVSINPRVAGKGSTPAPYILAQSAVPVMIAQSGLIQANGVMYPGASTTGVTVTLSATTGSVTVTLGSAILAGTSADVGKQITFYDAGTGWRSILITAFTSTTVCTGSLSGFVSTTSVPANTVYVGNPLPTNYSGIWVYLPAGAVSGGAAGFYWATAALTSTANSILQVTTTYQATMGVPYIPSGPFTNAVGSGSSFTQSTSGIILASATVPGGSLGANGKLREEAWWSASTTNQKNAMLQYGGTTIVSNAFGGLFNNVGLRHFAELVNRSTQNSNVFNSNISWGGVGAPFANVSIDTSVNQQATAVGQLTVATDFLVLDYFTAQVFPSA